MDYKGPSVITDETFGNAFDFVGKITEGFIGNYWRSFGKEISTLFWVPDVP